MKVTDVRIRKTKDRGNLKAIACVTFDEVFVVHDIKLIEGDKGMFIAMPSYKTKDGEYRDIAHPLNSETREMILREVLDKYNEVI